MGLKGSIDPLNCMRYRPWIHSTLSVTAIDLLELYMAGHFLFLLIFSSRSKLPFLSFWCVLKLCTKSTIVMHSTQTLIKTVGVTDTPKWKLYRSAQGRREQSLRFIRRPSLDFPTLAALSQCDAKTDWVTQKGQWLYFFISKILA